MIIPAPNDVALSFSGFNIYWYGIIMAISMFVAIIAGNKLLNYKLENVTLNLFQGHISDKSRNKFGVTNYKDLILSFAPVIIFFGILGARFYFCMLNPVHYLSNPLEILDIREGGLSIHGGIIGGILSVIIMSRKYNIPFLIILDCMSPATILGQAIGRWGNYFNSEAYGLPTANQNWGLFIPLQKRITEFSQYELFHPTFLYESILNFIAFFVLLFIWKKSKRKGITFFSYLIIYALIRFFIEQIRIDSALNIGSMPIALVVSIILFVIGIVGLINCKVRYLT